MTRIELAILIRGDHPSIAQLAGLGIGRAWHAGDRIPGSPTETYRTGGWEIVSTLPLTEPLRTHLQSVLDVADPIWPALRAAAAAGEVLLSVAMYVTAGAEIGPTDIGRDQITRLADISAGVDFDLYQFVPERG